MSRQLKIVSDDLLSLVWFLGWKQESLAFVSDSTDTMGSTAKMNGCDPALLKKKFDVDMYGPNLKILRTNDQVKELQTILRDK